MSNDKLPRSTVHEVLMLEIRKTINMVSKEWDINTYDVAGVLQVLITEICHNCIQHKKD